MYAKLAETFIYEEVTSSVDQGPEHEIVYVNTFADASEVPQYDDLAIIGMNLRAGPELAQINQLSAYVLQGLEESTHLFPEILEDMLTNARYGQRGVLPPQQINRKSITDTAAFCRSRKYFCDIAIAEPINRREWGFETADNHLLQLAIRNGEFSLEPIFYGLSGSHPFNGKEPITGMFNSGNVVEDSFEVSTADSLDQQPVRVSVRWRQERQSRHAERSRPVPGDPRGHGGTQGHTGQCQAGAD